jgi:valyl-tRNA synthetase
MIRKELWTDDPETLNRRLAIYATLWHVLKAVTLLFNPVTPYLSEALHQKVYRKLDPTLPESVNFESWPKPEEKMRNKRLEEEFQTLFKCVSLVYSARQSAKLKRRWPLKRMVLVASEEICSALEDVEELLLELANVKTAEYRQEAFECASSDEWASSSEDGLQVFLDVRRDESLLGEGLMRDLARRVQALRKELGYVPTDVLDVVYVAELEKESIRLLTPYLKEMEELVRTKKVYLLGKREEVEARWHEYQLDDRKIYVAIPE